MILCFNAKSNDNFIFDLTSSVLNIFSYFRPLLCKSLFSVVLFCSISVWKVVIMYYVSFFEKYLFEWHRIWTNFYWINTLIFSSLNENCELKNLLAKVEKVLTFLFALFIDLESMVHELLFQNVKVIIKDAHYFSF